MMSRPNKVIITGGCGFIGSSVVEQLVIQGYDLLVIDSLVIGSKATLPDPKKAQLLKADVRALTEKQLQGFHNAYWVHLAALPFVPKSFHDPLSFFEINAMGTAHVCELAIRTSAKRFVLISSSEVYRSSSKGTKLSEEAPLDPLSPYANSKLAAEAVVRGFSARGLPCVILRLFNCYGPRFTHPYFIPEMIKQCLTRREIHVGSLDTHRDFTYVTDTAEAIALVLPREGIEEETFNIGSGVERQMGEVLEKIQEVTGRKGKTIIVEASRKRPEGRDPYYLVANTDKAKSLLQWCPRVLFEDGLYCTVKGIEAALRA